MLDAFLKAKAAHENTARSIRFSTAQGKTMQVGNVKHEYMLRANEEPKRFDLTPARVEIKLDNRDYDHVRGASLSFLKLSSFLFVNSLVLLQKKTQSKDDIEYVARSANTGQGTALAPDIQYHMRVFAVMDNHRDVFQSLPAVMKSYRLLTGYLDRNLIPSTEAFFQGPMDPTDMTYIADILGADIEKNRKNNNEKRDKSRKKKRGRAGSKNEQKAFVGTSMSPYLMCHGKVAGTDAHVMMNVKKPLDDLRRKLTVFGHKCLHLDSIPH